MHNCGECVHFGWANGSNPNYFGGCYECIHNMDFTDCFYAKKEEEE